MAEQRDHVVAQVVRLQRTVVGVQAEFGGFDRQTEIAELIQYGKELCGRRHHRAEVRLNADAADGRTRVLQPVNGVVERVEKCFVVGANDKYEISIKFANSGGNIVSISLSLEPFGGYLCSGGSSGSDNGSFHSNILVNEGDSVTAGQLIGKMLVPAGSADDTHIHFHLNTDSVGFSCPNIFSSGIADVFDNKFSSTACGGGAFPQGGLCSQPGAGEDLTTLD